jgi:hypothetical protein
MTPPVIDWSAHKEPWRTIGPRFRVMCEEIAAMPLAGLAPSTPQLRGRRRETLKRAFAAAREVTREGA